MNLGTILRKHRKDNKLTLKQVAEKAGISEGFLSQVENNVNSPSVDTLINICNAIGVNAGDVLKQQESRERLVTILKKEWCQEDVPKSGFATRRFFRPEDREVIDSALLVIDPEKSIPVRKGTKNSQEVLCILNGTVELVYGDKNIELREGDAVHFWSNPEKQKIKNSSSVRAIVLWVGTL
jgi:transcriptional regulator with XRE-family HTH domain